MRNSLATFCAAALAALPVFVAPAVAGQKALPPAFGKELAPDESSRADPKSAEIEELEEEREEKAERQQRHAPGRQRGGKVHIQLDGDEDGGGTDGEDGDF